jgi:TPR repeat protein
MRTYIRYGLMIAMLSLSLIADNSVVFAGPLEDANTAYKHGDYATALQLLRPLAEQGNATAQFVLGIAYSEGRIVRRDYTEAEKWLLLAAEQSLRDWTKSRVGGCVGEGLVKLC